MAGLLTLDEALARVLGRVTALPSEPVAVEHAAGRVLARDALAATDLPPFASSAMDGFAVRSADTPGTLAVTMASAAAGRPATASVGAGEAIAIATGGVVPARADAVVPVEAVVQSGNSIEIPTPVEPGANIRPQAGDVGAGKTVVRGGARLGPAQLGALAAAGLESVECSPRPQAAVLATGTELRRAGEPLGPGEIYEANSLILTAQLEAAGAAVERLDSVGDDEESHRTAIGRGLGADLLVTSGGVSVGTQDLVRSVGAALGVEEVFWGVAVQPGKPVFFGLRGATLVFGLPGNPVSSLVSFELFVRPAVLALQGAASPGPVFLVGRLAADVVRGASRTRLVRARSRCSADAVMLEPLDGQQSHMIARAAEADALVLIEPGEGVVAAGAAARYLPLA